MKFCEIWIIVQIQANYYRRKDDSENRRLAEDYLSLKTERNFHLNLSNIYYVFLMPNVFVCFLAYVLKCYMLNCDLNFI